MEFGHMNPKEERQNHLAMLVKLATANGDTHVNELRMIHFIGTKMGLLPDDIEFVLQNHEQFEFKLASSEQERMNQLYHFLFLIRMDGKVSENETDMVRHLGFKLCINPDLVEELLQIVTRFMGEDLPDHLLTDTIKKYLN